MDENELTNDDTKNILDYIKSATDRFTKAENKQKEKSTNSWSNTVLSSMKAAVATKSLENYGNRRSETLDTVYFDEFTPLTLRQETDKYPKIYPTLSRTPSEIEAHDGHPVRPINSKFFQKRLVDMELKTKSTLSKLKFNYYRTHQQKNRMLALERIEAGIKKNMKRL